MANEINIRCKNTGKTFPMPLGCSLKEVYEQSGVTMNHGPVCASINNKVQGLNYRFYNSKDVELLDMTTADGMRTYTHTLFFVLAKAVEDAIGDDEETNRGDKAGEEEKQGDMKSADDAEQRVVGQNLVVYTEIHRMSPYH